jgi:hypothetical protein
MLSYELIQYTILHEVDKFKDKNPKCDISFIKRNINIIVGFELKYRETHHIFYHGQNPCHIFKDLVSQAFLNENHYYIYKKEYEGKSAIEIYNELNRIHKLIEHSDITDHDTLLRDISISCLNTIYGNSTQYSYDESVIKYLQIPTEYCKNVKVTSTSLFSLIKNHLSEHTIPVDYDSLESIYNEFINEVKTPQLVMFAIPKEKINTYVYKAKRNGGGELFSEDKDKYCLSYNLYDSDQYRIINLDMSDTHLTQENIHVLKINQLTEDIKLKYINKLYELRNMSK